MHFEAIYSPYLAPFDGSFRRADFPTEPEEAGKKKALKSALKDEVKRISDLQHVMYAENRHALLLVFQAMDAGGKDSTIRAVMSGVNPAGCQVFSFKRPSNEELDHDYLWRTSKRMPERGRIGVFNRSYYEEVLVVRVHPEILTYQRLPRQAPPEQIWTDRYASIRASEKHLALNGTVVLKFWLNVSRAEQKNRFLSRLNEPEKNWKFEAGDVRERSFWDKYMHAYEAAIAETSRPWAPWYAIPADNKPYMRLTVARIIRQTLESLEMQYPEVDAEAREKFAEMRSLLESD